MKQYLAHSAKDIYPAQPYETHIRHVLKKVEASLGEIAPFLSENHQNMFLTTARLAAAYHDWESWNRKTKSAFRAQNLPLICPYIIRMQAALFFFYKILLQGLPSIPIIWGFRIFQMKS